MLIQSESLLILLLLSYLALRNVAAVYTLVLLFGDIGQSLH